MGDFKKADVYSMGIILYILLTRQAPGPVRNEEGIIERYTPNFSVLDGNVSQEMINLILKMTDQDSETRISAEEVISELGETVPKKKNNIKSDDYSVNEKFDGLTCTDDENGLTCSKKTSNRKV